MGRCGPAAWMVNYLDYAIFEFDSIESFEGCLEIALLMVYNYFKRICLLKKQF